mmetsp:Transcript_23175/g.38347  ORF Transcript_23175/g.38347 Transcript_23175/m.38347 type:complete len:129 (-) Transcript_23175:38-424(-)
MIVPIESSLESSTTVQEWGLLELNGELVMPSSADAAVNDENAVASNNELELGCLKFSKDAAATPILILGAHELRGTVEKLKKPFAILKKRKREAEEGDDGNEPSSYYEVVGVITKKLLFAQYPKSIMR